MIHSEKCDHLEKFTGKLSFLFNLMIDIGEGPHLRPCSDLKISNILRYKKKTNLTGFEEKWGFFIYE